MRARLQSIAVLTAILTGFTLPTVFAVQEGGQKDKDLPKSEKLEPYKCGSVERLHTLGGVFLASQPKADDFKMAKEGGIKTVINLRKKEELDWDEEALVKQLGMEYHHLGFKSPAELTDEVFDATRKILNSKDKKPILLHCSTANRVGAVWLAHRVLDHGVGYEDALKEAETVGLKLPAYTEKAKAYIERNRKK
jgi:uncharacterized protein (TIGR01244 family)